MAKSEQLPPIHPGEILREDFMKPLGLSMNRLALDLHVPDTHCRDCARAAGHHSRYGPATGSLFQHQRALLAERPVELRS